jgi:hypothetical protein
MAFWYSATKVNNSVFIVRFALRGNPYHRMKLSDHVPFSPVQEQEHPSYRGQQSEEQNQRAEYVPCAH